VLAVVVPVVIVAMVGSFLLGAYWQNSAREDLEQEMLSRLLGQQETTIENSQFEDADGDLVADSPADDQCISPDSIVFSFIASEENRDQAAIWKEVMDALAQRLERPVQYVHFSRTDDQLAALKSGQLHVTVLNTGTVPTAVRTAGFVPLCTFADGDGSYGYTMQIIVPESSDIQEPAQLKGRTVTFTRPNSNSGFKAPLVLLMNDFNLRPERDYQWAFSLGHEESIAGIAGGKFQAAPVASDVLQRVAARGEVDPQRYRSIYESKRFPPATVGYVYNLPSELREGIQETLLGFNWDETALAQEYGEGGKFVAVSYQEDWEGTREIDEAFADARSRLVRTQSVRPAVSTPTSTGDVGESEETPDGPIRDEAADEDSAGAVASEDAQ
jgi:phosphonate transport system substrate-binding protein